MHNICGRGFSRIGSSGFQIKNIPPSKGELILYKSDKIMGRHECAGPVWDTAIDLAANLAIATTWAGELVIMSLETGDTIVKRIPAPLYGISRLREGTYLLNAQGSGIWTYETFAESP